MGIYYGRCFCYLWWIWIKLGGLEIYRVGGFGALKKKGCSLIKYECRETSDNTLFYSFNVINKEVDSVVLHSFGFSAEGSRFKSRPGPSE